MSKTIYMYDPVTSQYAGSKEARLSPLDLQQGREVYLIPKYTTEIEPPEAQENHVVVWDGTQWQQQQIYAITRTITKDINSTKLQNELDTAFPDNNIVIEGDIQASGSKTIVFHNLPDTQANLDALDALLLAHVAVDFTIPAQNKGIVALCQVLCEEISKVDAAFPTYETLCQLVSAKIDAMQ